MLARMNQHEIKCRKKMVKMPDGNEQEIKLYSNCPNLKHKWITVRYFIKII